MDNLFLQAIGNDKVETINRIKKNKEFLRKLIFDLQEVYTLYITNQDHQNGTRFSIAKFSNNRETIFFNANENGITFSTKLLGYRKCNTPSFILAWIIDKYDTCKGDSNFMADVENPHGWVDVQIKFTDVSANLMDIIRDIALILDYEKVAKRF